MTQTSQEVLPAGGGVNRAQRDYWETDGPRQYQQFGDANEALIAPLVRRCSTPLHCGQASECSMGCGFGTSTLEAAERWRRPAGLSASTSPLQCSSPPGSGSLPNAWTTSSCYTRMRRRTPSRPNHSTLSSAGSG